MPEQVLGHLADGVRADRAELLRLRDRQLMWMSQAVLLVRSDHQDAGVGRMTSTRLEQVDLADHVVQDRVERIGERPRDRRLAGQVVHGFRGHRLDGLVDGRPLAKIRLDQPHPGVQAVALVRRACYAPDRVPAEGQEVRREVPADEASRPGYQHAHLTDSLHGRSQRNRREDDRFHLAMASGRQAPSRRTPHPRPLSITMERGRPPGRSRVGSSSPEAGRGVGG
jgi:hypothetical protein